MKTKIFIVVFALFSALVSCKKAEKGDMGPAGANGTNGTNGNANVKLFYFGADTLTSTVFYKTHYFPSSVTSNLLDSSLVLCYNKISTNWYPVPGLGIGGAYQTRCYTSSLGACSFTEVILNPDGSSYTGVQQIFNKVKIVIIPSSNYSGFRTKPVDFNNYEETMKYFGLPLD